MELPKINNEKMSQIINQIESANRFKSFMDLCYKIAQSNWAQEEDLDAETVSSLILHHDLPTKTPKPGQEVVEIKPTPVPASKPSTTDLPDGRKSTGGKGRKQCGGCNMFLGIRTAICPCGFEFKKAVASIKPDVYEREEAEESEEKPVKKLEPFRLSTCPSDRGGSVRQMAVFGRFGKTDPDDSEMRWKNGREVNDQNLVDWAERFREWYRERFDKQVFLSNYAIWRYCTMQSHKPATGTLIERQDKVLVENADRILRLLGGNDKPSFL